MAFGVIKGRKEKKKDNVLPYISSRNNAASYVNACLDSAGYKYGDEVIIAREGKKPWRYDEVDNYKDHLHKTQNKDEWTKIKSVIDGSFILLENRINYTSVKSDIAEADDIIATIALLEENKDKEIIILSDDKDFKQLMVYCDNVRIYSPPRKKFIDIGDYSLHEHIIRGDSSDNIKSILSYGEGMVVKGKRRIAITERVKSTLFDENNNFIANEYDDVKNGYETNRRLIDFRYIPNEVKEDIIFNYRNRKLALETSKEDYGISS